MARKLVAENRTLHDLKEALLRDISARASVLLEEEAPESG
jgi:5'-deoxynucleotidase YfbR-like HD superfamily hydrolase